MDMKTIELKVSSDIYDKVIAFFEIFPKDKINIVQNNKPEKPQQKKKSLIDFFQSSPLVGL